MDNPLTEITDQIMEIMKRERDFLEAVTARAQAVLQLNVTDLRTRYEKGSSTLWLEWGWYPLAVPVAYVKYEVSDNHTIHCTFAAHKDLLLDWEPPGATDADSQVMLSTTQNQPLSRREQEA